MAGYSKSKTHPDDLWPMCKRGLAFLFFFSAHIYFFFVFSSSVHTVTERHTTLGLLACFTNAVLCCAALYQPLSRCPHLSSGGPKPPPRFLRWFSLFPVPGCEGRKRPTLMFLSPFLSGASGQRVKVEPEVLSYPGQTVNLRCSFSDTTGVQLTMVRGKKRKTFSFHIFSHFISVTIWLLGPAAALTHIHTRTSAGVLCYKILIKMSVSAWDCSSLCWLDAALLVENCLWPQFPPHKLKQTDNEYKAFSQFVVCPKNMWLSFTCHFDPGDE